MIKFYNYTGDENGVNILFLGAVHGDETCGKYAMDKIMEEIQGGKLNLKKGKITFVPISNPEAFSLNKRYINKNLNRVIRKYDTPSIYEEYLANEICELIDNCDILIDIHSFMSPGLPFVFQDYDDSQNLASSVGIDHIVKGWPQMYDDLDSPDTVGYAYSQGKKGILIECGENGSSHSTEVAYISIKRILSYFGVIEYPETLKTDIVSITAKKIFFKKNNGNLTKLWNHLDFVNAGEIIGLYENGETEKFEKDGYILLPNNGAVCGDEWFYFGEIN